jgi:ubiquinone/menaquinone biosynthesis C-methylase UbiE
MPILSASKNEVPSISSFPRLETVMDKHLSESSSHKAKVKDWLSLEENRTKTDWTLEHLRIEPYQHILELDYGSGNTLVEVAEKLKVGFIAGVDPSVSFYKQAYKKNKKFISRGLMQLHVSGVEELSYPPHYFHTIYSSNAYFFWNQPAYAFARLTRMLKSGGKLVLIARLRCSVTEEEVTRAVEKTKSQFLDAGLEKTEIEFRGLQPGTLIAALGYKP